MANVFDDIVNDIKNEERRKTLLDLVNSDPDVKSAIESRAMMQADYNRKLDELRTKTEYADKMASWRRDEFPKLEAEVRLKKELEQKLDQANRELAEARARAEANAAAAKDDDGNPILDYDKLASALETKFSGRFVTADQAKELAEKAKNDAVNFTAGTVISNYDSIQGMRTKAFRDLGIDLPTDLFIQEYQKVGNLDLAYRNLTEQKYREKQESEWEAKAKEREAAAFKKGQEQALGQIQHPDDMGSFQSDYGVLQQAQITAAGGSAKDIEIPPDYEAGTGGISSPIARKASAMYREMEAAGAWKH